MLNLTGSWITGPGAELVEELAAGSSKPEDFDAEYEPTAGVAARGLLRMIQRPAVRLTAGDVDIDDGDEADSLTLTRADGGSRLLCGPADPAGRRPGEADGLNAMFCAREAKVKEPEKHGLIVLKRSGLEVEHIHSDHRCGFVFADV